jgi:2-oxo-4-hydroxy-4-carboxy-5-ureidoimidazoline decarboxylase
MPYTLADVNQMDQTEFIHAFGTIFEHTPEIAAIAWNQRPFSSPEAVYMAMVAAVDQFSLEQQLALVRSHPDLGSKAAMAEASVQEQQGAGLDSLSPEEFERFQQLNQAYQDRFGFPFIVAVKHHTKESILAAFAERLTHDSNTERQQALTEIKEIVRLRLMAAIQGYSIGN